MWRHAIKTWGWRASLGPVSSWLIVLNCLKWGPQSNSSSRTTARQPVVKINLLKLKIKLSDENWELSCERYFHPTALISTAGLLVSRSCDNNSLLTDIPSPSYPDISWCQYQALLYPVLTFTLTDTTNTPSTLQRLQRVFYICVIKP